MNGGMADFLIRREIVHCFFADDLARLVRRLNLLDHLFADVVQAFVLFCEQLVALREDFDDEFGAEVLELVGLSEEELEKFSRFTSCDLEERREYLKKIAEVIEHRLHLKEESCQSIL